MLIYAPSGDCIAFWEEKAAESKQIQHTVMSVFINRGLALLPSTAAGCDLGSKAGAVHAHKVSNTIGRAVCRGGLSCDPFAWRDFVVSPPYAPPATCTLLPSRFTC